MRATLHQLLTSGHRPDCYVASPLGFSEATRGYYREVYLPTLARYVTPVDPWALTSPGEIEAARRQGRARELYLEVGARNARAIESCRMLIAHLDGQEVDSGTAAEVGYAAGRGLPCVGVRSDLRQSGEPEMAVNLQVESFIVRSGGFVAASLDALLGELAARAGGQDA